MGFQDRTEAGKRLAEALKHHARRENTLVLGLPRGGVVVAAPVAAALQLPLDAWISRKIGAPGNPEYGIGAVSHGDTLVWDEPALTTLGLSPDDFADDVTAQRRELDRRVIEFRRRPRPPDVAGKNVILVDDGFATGVTSYAAIEALRKGRVRKIILALPVAPRQALADLRSRVDELVVLETPEQLDGVGRWYDDFHQATDTEVVRALAAGVESEGAA